MNPTAEQLTAMADKMAAPFGFDAEDVAVIRQLLAVFEQQGWIKRAKTPDTEHIWEADGYVVSVKAPGEDFEFWCVEIIDPVGMTAGGLEPPTSAAQVADLLYAHRLVPVQLSSGYRIAAGGVS